LRCFLNTRRGEALASPDELFFTARSERLITVHSELVEESTIGEIERDLNPP
jgi:hypothetical protein